MYKLQEKVSLLVNLTSVRGHCLTFSLKIYQNYIDSSGTKVR
jgi:hypothetical protein